MSDLTRNIGRAFDLLNKKTVQQEKVEVHLDAINRILEDTECSPVGKVEAIKYHMQKITEIK